MTALIWIGTGVSALGLVGIVLSAIRVAGARRAGLSDQELRAAIQKALPLNLGAFFLSVLGLMAVIVGISLS